MYSSCTKILMRKLWFIFQNTVFCFLTQLLLTKQFFPDILKTTTSLLFNRFLIVSYCFKDLGLNSVILQLFLTETEYSLIYTETIFFTIQFVTVYSWMHCNCFPALHFAMKVEKKFPYMFLTSPEEFLSVLQVTLTTRWKKS